MTLRVVDAQGDTVRTLKAKGKHGINRVWWDLRCASAKKIDFLTPPPDAPWAKAHRRYAAYGIAAPEPGPIVAPGTYTMELTAAGDTLSRKLVVKPDPHSAGPDTALIRSARKLEHEAVAVESRLVDVRTTGRSEDIFWHPMKLYGRLSWLITEMDGRARRRSLWRRCGRKLPTAPTRTVEPPCPIVLRASRPSP